MTVNRTFSLDRKSFLTMLSMMGLGLGLVVATVGGVPGASAQETSTPVLVQDEAGSAESETGERLRLDEMREELYAEFTAALADELSVGNSDEVDAAIRVAMMSVVDDRVDEGLLTVGQAEALKLLIATSDAPLGPGAMFGPPHGAFMRGLHGPGGEGRFFQIRDGGRHVIIGADGDSRTADAGNRDAGSDKATNDDQSNEDEDVATS
jgi:hypothetical protein